MEELQHIYRRDVLEFVTVATEFCKQLEQCPGSERGEFTSPMQRLIPMVYLKATLVEEVEEGIGYVEPAVTEADYEWITKKIMLIANRHSQGRIVSVLEGGYKLTSLAKSAKAHIACLVKASPFI